MPADEIEAAKAKLDAADAAQRKRDAACAAMVLAAAPLQFDVGKAKRAVEAARAVGVAADLIEMVEAKMTGDARRRRRSRRTPRCARRSSRLSKAAKAAERACAGGRAEEESDSDKVLAEVAPGGAARRPRRHGDRRQGPARRREGRERRGGGGDNCRPRWSRRRRRWRTRRSRRRRSRRPSRKIIHKAENLLHDLEATGEDAVPFGLDHIEPREQCDEEVDEDIEWLHRTATRASRRCRSRRPTSAAARAPRRRRWRSRARRSRAHVVAGHAGPGGRAQGRAARAGGRGAQGGRRGGGEGGGRVGDLRGVRPRLRDRGARGGPPQDRGGLGRQGAAAYAAVHVTEQKKKDLAKAAALAKVQPRPVSNEKAKEVKKAEAQASGKKSGGFLCCGSAHDVIEINVAGRHRARFSAPPPPASNEPAASRSLGSRCRRRGRDAVSRASTASAGRRSAAPRRATRTCPPRPQGSRPRGRLRERGRLRGGRARDGGGRPDGGGALRRGARERAAEPAGEPGARPSRRLRHLALEGRPATIEAKDASTSAGDIIYKVVDATAYVFNRTLRALLETHYTYSEAAKAATAAAAEEEGVEAPTVASAGGLGRLVSQASTLTEGAGAASSHTLPVFRSRRRRPPTRRRIVIQTRTGSAPARPPDAEETVRTPVAGWHSSRRRGERRVHAHRPLAAPRTPRGTRGTRPVRRHRSSATAGASPRRDERGGDFFATSDAAEPNAVRIRRPRRRSATSRYFRRGRRTVRQHGGDVLVRRDDRDTVRFTRRRPRASRGIYSTGDDGHDEPETRFDERLIASASSRRDRRAKAKRPREVAVRLVDGRLLHDERGNFEPTPGWGAVVVDGDASGVRTGHLRVDSVRRVLLVALATARATSSDAKRRMSAADAARYVPVTRSLCPSTRTRCSSSKDAADGAYFFARGGGRVVASRAGPRERRRRGRDGASLWVGKRRARGRARGTGRARPFFLAEFASASQCNTTRRRPGGGGSAARVRRRRG